MPHRCFSRQAPALWKACLPRSRGLLTGTNRSEWPFLASSSTSSWSQPFSKVGGIPSGSPWSKTSTWQGSNHSATSWRSRRVKIICNLGHRTFSSPPWRLFMAHRWSRIYLSGARNTCHHISLRIRFLRQFWPEGSNRICRIHKYSVGQNRYIAQFEKAIQTYWCHTIRNSVTCVSYQ